MKPFGSLVVTAVFAVLATAEVMALVLGVIGIMLGAYAVWRTIVIGRALQEVTDKQTTATTALTERAAKLDRQMLGDA